MDSELKLIRLPAVGEGSASDEVEALVSGVVCSVSVGFEVEGGGVTSKHALRLTTTCMFQMSHVNMTRTSLLDKSTLWAFKSTHIVDLNSFKQDAQ